MVGYTHIVAPFDGVITARFVDPGALIQADGARRGSRPQAEQRQRSGRCPWSAWPTSARSVYVYVPEEETSADSAGMPATLRLREFPGREFTGTVARFATRSTSRRARC